MLTAEQATELGEMFRLLGDPNRLRMAALCLERPMNVGELTEALGLTQSLVSHHLRLLRGARLLKSDRQGRQIFYRLPDCHVRQMLTNMIDHVSEPHDAEGHLVKGKPS